MGVYYQLYDILNTYLYGVAELTSYQELTLTLFCTGICILCVALPVGLGFKLILGWLFK